tara:strand:- start:200 stop:1036 length:837 start_codon:yes stop_codon:yes gene_type:complete
MYRNPQETADAVRASERMLDKRSKYALGGAKKQAKKALGRVGSTLIRDSSTESTQQSPLDDINQYRIAMMQNRESMVDVVTAPLSPDNGTASVPESTPELPTLTERLYGKKGTGKNEVVSHSYYNDPLDVENFTRSAGGAPKKDQEKAIRTIIETGRSLDASDEEIAYALATARTESGFNIYAAARSSSAYGLGQFINKTGKSYGLNQDNRDDIQMQAQALIEHTQYNFDLAEKRGKGLEYVYKYHHDGPSKDSGGLSLSKKNVMPYLDDYKKIVENF